MVSYFVGDRGAESAMILMDDLRLRLSNPTDGHKAYLDAVEEAFGADVDYAQLVKLYGTLGGNSPEKRYSPAECIGAKKVRREGNPDIAHVNTDMIPAMTRTRSCRGSTVPTPHSVNRRWASP